MTGGRAPTNDELLQIIAAQSAKIDELEAATPIEVAELLDAPLKNHPVNGGPQVNMTLREWLEADTRVPHKRAREKAYEAILAALQAKAPETD